MASKKEWKRRAQALQQLADDLLRQSVGRGEELAKIDEMLLNVEFPGPTIEAYVAQTQQFLQRLVEERGLVKKSSTADPVSVRTEASTSVPVSRSPKSTVDGEYTLLTDGDLMATTRVPAGPNRFA